MAKNVGLPAWNDFVSYLPPAEKKGAQSTRYSSVDPENDTLVFIPFKKVGSDQVSSFLACAVGEDSVTLKLFRGDLYPSYDLANKDTARVDTISGDLVALMCMQLEYLSDTARRNTFRINDRERLFKYSDRPEKGTTLIKMEYNPHNYRQASSNRMEYVWITVCVSVQVWNFEGQVVGIPPGQNVDWVRNETNCYTVGWWMDIISDPWAGTGGGTVPVITSGGGWYDDPPPCRTTPNGNPCSGDPGGGWTPVVDYPEYNPYIYDTIGVSTYLKDSFPCLAAFLDDSLPNGNLLAQLAGNNVFKDSAHMHITFDTSGLHTTDDGVQAFTKERSQPYIGDDGVTHFSVVIRFNPWYLKNATKESMIGTIIHESMHAIFTLRWGQYVRWRDFGLGSIDSTWMINHYPTYFYGIANQHRPLSELQDHEMMAADYFNFFSREIKKWWNPNAPQAVRDSVIKALFWDGLTETTAWKNLPSHGVDTCKYSAMARSAARSHTVPVAPPGCSYYNCHYSDSLKLRPSCN